MTRWAADVEPDLPWNLYPRPAMERDNWINLNGLWNYAIIPDSLTKPTSFDGKILVPYPIESALSGVMKRVGKNDLIWYSRTIQVPKLQKKERLILHLEACDWHTRVLVNGEQVGEHRGGYLPFSFDLTDWVKADEEALLEVVVQDPTTEGTQAVGKQNSNPHGIWYTPTSGIWQTIWLETVPESFISDYDAIADIDRQLVSLSAQVANHQAGDQVVFKISLDGKEFATTVAEPGKSVEIVIRDMKLWEPGNPVLYDLNICLKRDDKPLDEVKGYFGMRKISIGKDQDGFTRLLLNNRFVFQNGPLDQGFWPDGLYTPPTEEAMVYDLEMLQKMGFNMLRKHVKVENRRFYYHTDHLGLLVWQDMPNAWWGRPVEEIRPGKGHTLQFEEELQDLIFTLNNHPSIVMWVPFNEGWGQYDTERITARVKQLDPTRLVNNASGWTDKGVGDVHDIHHYPEPVAPPAEENRASVLGEFGGLGLPVPGHTWQQDQNWGYENMPEATSLLAKYESFYSRVQQLVREQGLSAVVYTQTTDVEIETNGLMSYDREVDKMGYEQIRKAHLGYHPPVLKNQVTWFLDVYQLELQTQKPGGIIYFTTDGSEPDRTSQLYSTPVELTESTQVKAMTIWKDGERSRTISYQIEKTEALKSVKKTVSPGLRVSLFRGAWENLPDFETLEAEKTGIATGLNLQPAGELTEDFGLLFEGYIKIPATGVYQFTVSSDDGGRLIIGDQQVVDYDGIHGQGEKKGIIALEKGLHSIQFHYFQHLGGRGLSVFVESETLKKEQIVSSMLYHE